MFLCASKGTETRSGAPRHPIGAPEKDMLISFGAISQSDDAIATIVHVIFVAWR